MLWPIKCTLKFVSSPNIVHVSRVKRSFYDNLKIKCSFSCLGAIGRELDLLRVKPSILNVATKVEGLREKSGNLLVKGGEKMEGGEGRSATAPATFQSHVLRNSKGLVLLWNYFLERPTERVSLFGQARRGRGVSEQTSFSFLLTGEAAVCRDSSCVRKELEGNGPIDQRA